MSLTGTANDLRAPAAPRSVANATSSARVGTLPAHALRYGLVVVLCWIGGMKFTAYEAEAISPFVLHSPLLSWAYWIFGTQGFSNLLGVSEIGIGLMVAARPLSARTAAAGGGLAVLMFLTTLSFLFTTPGVWAAPAGGFPALSVVPGQFLVKDLVLLAASLWVFDEARNAAAK